MIFTRARERYLSRASASPQAIRISDPFNSANAQTCSYIHDDLSRIGGSSTTAGVNCVNASQQAVWSQTFTYDPFGNITKVGNPGSSFQPTYNTSTNQMTSIGGQTPTYDANGNVTNDYLNSYASWDQYGRPTAVNGVGITYDALGRTVELNKSGTYNEIQYSPTGFKMQLINGSTLVKAFVPMPGGAAEVWTPTATFFRHADWLGSSRLASNVNRTIYYDGAYGPFGEQYANTGATDLSFTGMNQDISSNVYDFPAREYGIQGRWPSPDPAGLGAADSSNPQSFNRYAYSLNSPLNVVDPSGLGGQQQCKSSGCSKGGGDYNCLFAEACNGEPEFFTIDIPVFTGTYIWAPIWDLIGNSLYLFPEGFTVGMYANPDFINVPIIQMQALSFDISGMTSDASSSQTGQQTGNAQKKPCVSGVNASGQIHGQTVTQTVTGCFGFACASANGDISVGTPSLGGTVDTSIDAPDIGPQGLPPVQISIGLGKFASVGTYFIPGDPNPHGFVYSAGWAIGPPLSISVVAHQGTGCGGGKAD